jgi:glycosyltransferase involved in cell wall biosynthesis
MNAAPGMVKDITKEYQSARLFVMPSRYESFSLTTVEALAQRRAESKAYRWF